MRLAITLLLLALAGPAHAAEAILGAHVIRLRAEAGQTVAWLDVNGPNGCAAANGIKFSRAQDPDNVFLWLLILAFREQSARLCMCSCQHARISAYVVTYMWRVTSSSARLRAATVPEMEIIWKRAPRGTSAGR